MQGMITSAKEALANAVRARDEPSSKKPKSADIEGKIKEMGPQNQALFEALTVMMDDKLEKGMDGVDKSLAALADATDQGFAELKQDLDEEKKARVTSQEENDKKWKDVKEEVHKLSSGGVRQTVNPGPSMRSAVASPAAGHASTPFDQRVVARMGNLGWDCSKEIATTRAKEVLEKAGVKPGDYVGLAASFGQKGSSVELCFTSPMLLQKAKFAISDLEVAYRTDKAPVWLNVKKDREEMRPARVVHRVTDLIEEAESGRSDGLEVEKKMNGKKVLLGPQGNQHIAGYSNKGVWMWTQWSRNRYTQEFLEMAKAFAEDD